jgi:hypothetical protein
MEKLSLMSGATVHRLVSCNPNKKKKKKKKKEIEIEIWKHKKWKEIIEYEKRQEKKVRTISFERGPAQ